ncbi:laccase domain-containing protein [Escherichia coli]|uniref:laccase domain-containing protein n=1 Tax=Escherichia coli TaxID=562 RepID=UPI001FCA6176|nr:laccase domain-containing protein [Escherichia coli]
MVISIWRIFISLPGSVWRTSCRTNFGGNRCTYTENETFFSYRRDKTTGRMASFIWLIYLKNQDDSGTRDSFHINLVNNLE